MKKNLGFTMALLLILITALSSGCATTKVSTSEVPLPPSEANIPIIVAEPWVQVVSGVEGHILEGPAFDRDGNLYVTSPFEGRIFKITPDKKVTTILSKERLMPGGIAIHRDGRLFVCCGSGNIITMTSDGSILTYIKTPEEGKLPNIWNDIVFDSKGNLYVTDCTGTASNPTGGLYHFSAASGYKTMTPVFTNMAMANGVALAPEGNIIYLVETGRSSLHRLEMLPDGITIVPIAGAIVAYHTVGAPAADSMKVDSKGNLYLAMNFQGRCLIMNKYGIPIAHALIPGRDEGRLLATANLAFKPGTDEVYITAAGKGGGWIYRFRGLAPGLTLFSHQ